MNVNEQTGDTSSNSELEGLDLNDKRIQDILRQNNILDEPKGEENEGDEGETINTATKETDESQVDADEGDEQSDDGSNDSKESNKNNDDQFTDVPKKFRKTLKRKQRQVSRLEAELQAAKQRLQELDSTDNKPTTDRRKKNSFANEEDYIEYVALERIKELQNEAQKVSLTTEIQEKEYQQLAQSWEEKLSDNFPTEDEQVEYQESLERLGHPNDVFDERINEYIFKNPNGPKMLKYFADRQSAISTLNNMHDWDLASALQQISNYVSNTNSGSANKSQPKKKVSNATAPVGKLGKSSKGATQDIENMSDEELLSAYRSGAIKF